jgi:hypothetical protein
MAKPWKAIYAALFLTEQSAVIAKALGQRIAPTLSNVFAHHLTLKFRPNVGEVVALPIGKEMDVVVTGYVVDERACALVCEIPSGIEYNNDAPAHITLSTGNDDEGKKIPPKVSKDLVSEVEVKTFNPPIRLKVKVGLFNGKEDLFDLDGSIY